MHRSSGQNLAKVRRGRPGFFCSSALDAMYWVVVRFFLSFVVVVVVIVVDFFSPFFF